MSVPQNVPKTWRAIQLVLTTEEQVVAIPMPQIMGNSRRATQLVLNAGCDADCGLVPQITEEILGVTSWHVVSNDLCGALDDTQFVVIEGLGMVESPGVSLPGDSPTCKLVSVTAARSCGCVDKDVASR